MRSIIVEVPRSLPLALEDVFLGLAAKAGGSGQFRMASVFLRAAGVAESRVVEATYRVGPVVVHEVDELPQGCGWCGSTAGQDNGESAGWPACLSCGGV